MNGVSRRQRVYDSREYVIHNRQDKVDVIKYIQKMYFYYKMYTICKLFYNTLSPSGELCISLHYVPLLFASS